MHTLSRKTLTRRANHGFTLVELLVVLAILGLLAGLVGPMVLNQLGGAKSKTAKIQIKDFEQALDIYKLDVGRVPSAQEGLKALVERPGNVSGWNGPYLKKSELPKDPWGRDYVYTVPGKHGEVDIISLGADGTPGGEGENADIQSWD
ncbi:MAG TPA: type II secretion system protein GspG [bacterium]|nr:type II secretion system protein GspG [bacterium]